MHKLLYETLSYPLLFSQININEHKKSESYIHKMQADLKAQRRTLTGEYITCACMTQHAYRQDFEAEVYILAVYE